MFTTFVASAAIVSAESERAVHPEKEAQFIELNAVITSVGMDESEAHASKHIFILSAKGTDEMRFLQTDTRLTHPLKSIFVPVEEVA